MENVVTSQPAILRSLFKPLLALLLCVGSANARAGATLNSATVNGATSVNVVPGTALTINVNLTLTGNTDWQSTRLTTLPASSLSVCSELPSYTTSGTYNQAFSVNAPDTNGTYTLVVTSYEGARCTTQSDTGNLNAAIVTDSTSPRVVSIVRTSPNPTNASPVTWTLTFDREVLGVTLDDFNFDAVGVTGLSLGGTYNTGDTSIYRMTTTNTGSGTLGLNIIDNDSIVGPNGLPLGGAGAGNGDFTGQVYTIDRAGPTFPNVTISSNYLYSASYARTGDIVRVTFTMADATTFQTPTAFINGVAATITGSGANWVATRTMTATDPEGPVTFRLEGKDGFGNISQRTTVTDATSVTIDRTPPAASIACATACGTANPANIGQVSWIVTFTEPVTGVSANNFSLTGTGSGGSTTIASVSGGPSAYTVVANANNAGLLGLNFSSNLTNVRDRANIAPTSTVSAVAGNTYTIGGCSVAAGGGCTFDVVETGGAIGSPIFTKRMGANIKLDLLALNGAVFNSSSNDTVVATLVVASNKPDCGTTEVSAQMTETFTSANGGRRSVTFVPLRAAKDVRVRLVSGAITACSRDNFALRPDAFTVSSTNANADLNGSSSTATPTLKAGRALFTIQASSVAGYDGTPLISQKRKLTLNSAAGLIAGDFSAATTGGIATGAAFTYDEVGYFQLDSWGVYDNTFTAVDSIKSPADCRGDSNLGTEIAPADPNNASGMMGCYFGNMVRSPYFGRFIPDHFALSAGPVINRSVTSACAASTFTYMGEQLTPTFVLTAQNAGDKTTKNYTGTFARLSVATQLGMGVIDDAPARRPLSVCAATPVGPCVKLGIPVGDATTNGTDDFGNGVSDTISAPFIIERATVAVAPYTVLKVAVAPIDPDGVRLATYNLDTVNVTAGANQRALVGTTMVRYGRMQIDNAYGSELLNLNVKVAAQYWTGTAYVTNIDDSCTPLGTAGLQVTDQMYGINASNMKDANLVGSSAIASGMGRVLLTKPIPVPTSKGRALLKSRHSYLPGSGRVTFGVYKAGPVIYVRETY